jgi:hypothetical protein
LKKSSEHNEQRQLILWKTLMLPNLPELQNLFAIPNGTWTTHQVGGRMKAEGVSAGVPDLFLAWPAQHYHGLFIEMKYGNGTTSREQREWILRLENAGYKVVVCFSFLSARNVILDYLGK